MTLNIGHTNDGKVFSLPDTLLVHTVAILAKRRAGKTYAAGVIEEEFAEAGLPFIVLDPVGVHYGIRSKASGRRSAYPIVVFGGEHGDVAIERKMGAQIAAVVVEENISCIIDLSELSKGAWREFTRDFCRELYRKNRNTTPRHVFIEEATEFIPQVRRPEMQEVYESVERLVRMGGNRGLGITLISQRSAQIAKDVLSQMDVLIALRTIGPHDRKAMLDMFQDVLEEEDLPSLEEFKSTIAKLADGEAWVWSPEYLKCFTRVNIREKRTFHAGASVMGEVQLVQAKPDVSALRKRLAPPPEAPTTGDVADVAAVHGGEITSLKEANDEQVRIINQLEDLGTEKDKQIADLATSGEAGRHLHQALAVFMRDAVPLYQTTGEGDQLERIPTTIDKEEIIAEVLKRIPANGQAPLYVIPAEALRKKYLNEAVDRIYKKIELVGEKPRRAMEVLLSNQIYWSISSITKAVGSGMGGQQIQNWRDAVKELVAIGLVIVGGKGRAEYKADVASFARSELSVHSPTDQELDQVVQHVLAKVATA